MTDPALSAIESGMVTGLFAGRDGAECAFQAAVELGYESSDVDLVMSDETRQRLFPGEHRGDTALSGKAAEPTKESSRLAHELGGPAGGTMGTIAPVLAAVGTLVLIPGITFAGPIAVALAAAGAVGLAGGLIGALTHWGIPKHRLHQYETGVRDGGILMGVKPRRDDDASELVRRWKVCGGELVHS
jgi:hypothetical protein